MASIPFILPHELLHNLLQKDPDLLAALSGSQLEPGLEKKGQKGNKHQKKAGVQDFKDKFCAKFGIPFNQCIGLGVFGDGGLTD